MAKKPKSKTAGAPSSKAGRRLVDRRDNWVQVNWPPEIKSRYEAAIAELRARVGDGLDVEEMLELECMLVRECEDARAAVGADPHAEQRQSDKAAAEAVEKFQASARYIANFMEQFPQQATLIVLHALLSLRSAGLEVQFTPGQLAKSDGQRPPGFVADGTSISGTVAFRRLAEQLASSAPARRGAVFLHNSAINGLVFSRSIRDDKRRPARETVLGFHLVFWLRSITRSAEVRRRDERISAAKPAAAKKMQKAVDAQRKRLEAEVRGAERRLADAAASGAAADQVSGLELRRIEAVARRDEHRGGAAVQDGAPLPTSGRPHYEVANAFISAALGEENVPADFDIKSRLDKHPWGDWQYLAWSLSSPNIPG